MSEETQKKEITNHPFIVRKKEICDGSPIIEGPRTRVIDMEIEYEALGHSPDEIIDNHPYLDLSQVHDALSYYYENRDELDRKIEHDKEFTRQLKKMFPSKIEKIREQD